MSKFVHLGDEKKTFVKKMFNDISKKYDLFNTLSSFGVDRYWRKKLTDILNLNETDKMLDVATGTGDVVFSIYKKYKSKCIGVDIAEEMIKLAIIKQKTKNISTDYISFIEGDAECLKFSDHTFDALTISFGFRNLSDYDKALEEFYRVLKPDGKIVILEFSEPRSKVFSPLFRFYFNKIVPLIGSMLARKDAFLYLPESVDHFLTRELLINKMKKHGFKDVSFKDYTFGVATIFLGSKS